IKPVMARYGEIYTAYEWHTIDVERGRVIFYMQNRRDHPGGQGTIDFPGVSLLEYAGGGKWKREEDFWAWKQREVAMKAYEDARRQFDPEHAKKKTRWNWGNGPEWTRGGRSWAERPQDRWGRGRGRRASTGLRRSPRGAGGAPRPPPCGRLPRARW